MKTERKKLRNVQKILKIIVLTPIIWMGTFGNNQICENFIYFFNFIVCVFLLALLSGKEKMKEYFSEDDYVNDYLLMFSWLLPAGILVADGWIISGIIWFLTWAASNSFNSSLKKIKNDKQNNDTQP